MDFKERFKTSPPVKYIEENVIKPRYAKRFKTAYAKFIKSYKPSLSKTRRKQIEAFYRNLKKLPNDMKYCERVSLRFINKKVGYGVFAKEDIPPYSILHHYVGELLPTDILNPDHDSTFSFEHFDEFSIDAMKEGNWTRFMNHSDIGEPSNNVVVWEYYAKDMPRIVFTAGVRGIKKGAQLLYSYGEEYWENKKSIDLS